MCYGGKGGGEGCALMLVGRGYGNSQTKFEIKYTLSELQISGKIENTSKIIFLMLL